MFDFLTCGERFARFAAFPPAAGPRSMVRRCKTKHPGRGNSWRTDACLNWGTGQVLTALGHIRSASEINRAQSTPG